MGRECRIVGNCRFISTAVCVSGSVVGRTEPAWWTQERGGGCHLRKRITQHLSAVLTCVQGIVAATATCGRGGTGVGKDNTVWGFSPVGSKNSCDFALSEVESITKVGQAQQSSLP